jgi:hypothetical protein
MKNQKPVQIDGVRERYVSGAGATPVLRTSRVGFAALVAPAPGTSGIQNISGADTKCICSGYKSDQFSFDRWSVTPSLEIATS